MEKLEKWLDVWEEGRKVAGLRVTLHDVRRLQDCYRKLRAGEVFCFVEQSVQRVLEKAGIRCVEDGVGWKAIPRIAITEYNNSVDEFVQENDNHWQEVMNLAMQYGFILQAYGGTATLVTHKNQRNEFGDEKYLSRQKQMFRKEPKVIE